MGGLLGLVLRLVGRYEMFCLFRFGFGFVRKAERRKSTSATTERYCNLPPASHIYVLPIPTFHLLPLLLSFQHNHPLSLTNAIPIKLHPFHHFLTHSLSFLQHTIVHLHLQHEDRSISSSSLRTRCRCPSMGPMEEYHHL